MNRVREQAEGVRFLKRVVEGHLTTPLLLVGDEGVGRRFSVTEAAREAFTGDTSDDFHSVQIDQDVHPDFVLVTPEGSKDIGVEAIRQVVELAYSFPSSVPVRYVTIDGVDRLTPAAANALLKTLEEPPRTTRFFLLSQSSERVIPTIRSRCGYVRYRPLSEALIVDHLKVIESDPAKALVYARLAEGSVGRATQYRLTSRLELRNRMASLLKTGLGGDVSSLFARVDEVGVDDIELGLRFLNHLLHDLIMITVDPSRISNIDMAEEIQALAAGVGEARTVHLIHGLRDLRDRMRTKINLLFHVKACLASTFVE